MLFHDAVAQTEVNHSEHWSLQLPPEYRQPDRERERDRLPRQHGTPHPEPVHSHQHYSATLAESAGKDGKTRRLLFPGLTNARRFNSTEYRARSSSAVAWRTVTPFTFNQIQLLNTVTLYSDIVGRSIR